MAINIKPSTGVEQVCVSLRLSKQRREASPWFDPVFGGIRVGNVGKALEDNHQPRTSMIYTACLDAPAKAQRRKFKRSPVLQVQNPWRWMFEGEGGQSTAPGKISPEMDD